MVAINVPDPSVPYLILLLNCLIFRSARQFALGVTTDVMRPFVTEFIATLELCADCAELGVAWEMHGYYVFAFVLFLKCLWWGWVFGDAEACPCGPVEQATLYGAPLSELNMLLKLGGQIAGAVATHYYTQGMWCFHLLPEHAKLHTKRCVASLSVPMYTGALIEGIITFVSRMVALESASWSPLAALWANSAATTGLVIVALDTTGGFFNPIMASALTLNCKGNSLLEHVVVYWIGSLLGGILAHYLHVLLRTPPVGGPTTSAAPAAAPPQEETQRDKQE